MDLHSQLIRDEGCRLVCYQDTLGNWTAGVGHKVASNIGTITQAQADAWLDEDIATATHQLQSAFNWVAALEAAEPIRVAALTNMVFNLGIGGVSKFHHLLYYIQQKDWQKAAPEMLNSVWATQVGPRAIRLSKQIETGVWQ